MIARTFASLYLTYLIRITPACWDCKGRSPSFLFRPLCLGDPSLVYRLWVHYGREIEQTLDVKIHWSETVYNTLELDARQARQMEVVRHENDEIRSSG